MNFYQVVKPGIVAAVMLLAGCSGARHPISLHPDNPHYFLWRGNPAILVGSTEHYGAVLNLDFDFDPYFKALEKDGLNLTRVFSGIYCEHSEAFNITENTLAPDSGRLICPWARSDQPGYAHGGNKFDLNRWDAAYFARLNDFIMKAASHDVVVELVLFCPFYGDEQWALSPLNMNNNINGIGDAGRTEVFTLQHGDLTEVQDRMVRKIVTEVNAHDNLTFEICNEPYFAGPTLAWQAHVSALIRETENALPKRHLIAQNIQNNSARVVDADPNVDIFNFHYSLSEAVDWNFHLNRPIGDDETGFAGTEDRPYRKEGWNFLMSGGALFDHLDYSFTVNHEDGTFDFPASQPGGGGVALRRQFGFMKRFFEGLDLIMVRPAQEILKGGVPRSVQARFLAEPGRTYAGYFMRQQTLATDFSLRWTGQIRAPQSGVYTFITITDDGVRLWIDGQRLIDDWTSHAPTENDGSIRLEAGEAVPFRMEYYQGMGGATAELLWSGPDMEKTRVPNDCFTLPGGNAPGLKLEWFNDTQLEKFRADAVVFNPDFDGSLTGIFQDSEERTALEPALEIPAGTYLAKWIDPVSGESLREEEYDHHGGVLTLHAPEFDQDLVMHLRVLQ